MATLTPGGYTWVGGRHDPIRKINPHNRAAINRANRRATGSIGGGGRSNLDAAQGRSRQGVTTPRFAQQTYGGGDGKGGQGNIYRPSGVHPGVHPGKQSWITKKSGSGITATAPGQEYITRTTDDEDKHAAFDHRATAHFAPWWGEVMEQFGGLTEGALRGSRLHRDYKDRAVAAGGTKAEGSKAWEADKRAMMTDKDQAFYDKYMNLADMATDNEKAAEYRKTAETAWRNKQTSDRLAAATGFEDYLPDKYIDKRYTGSHPRAGEFVPGVGRMNEVAENLGFGGWYPNQGTGRSMAEGRDAIASQMNVDPSLMAPDYEIGEHWSIDDTPFGLTETEDITADYTPYPDEKWGAPINYNPYRDEDYGAPLYGFREGRKPNLASLFGIPAFMDTEESYGLMPGAKLPYDMSEEEETFIKPNTDLRGKYLPR